MSTIIECPACSTRYKMNKAIPEGGRSVKCARCGHQWRLLPEEPEELMEALDDEAPEQAPAIPAQQPEADVFARQPHAASGEAQADSRQAPAVNTDAAFGGDPDGSYHAPEPRDDLNPAYGYARPAFGGSNPPHYAAAAEEAESDAGYSADAGAVEAGPRYHTGGFAEDATRFSPGPAYPAEPTEYVPEPVEGEPDGPAWDVRRGNLAAALASMSEAIEADPTHAHLQADRGETAGMRRWDAEAGTFESDLDMSAAGFPSQTSNPLSAPPVEGPLSGTAPGATSMETTLESYARELGAAGLAGQDWPTSEPPAALRRDVDPELSIREVLKAVMDDPQDDAEAGQKQPARPGLPPLRPAFADDPDLDDDGADPRREWAARSDASPADAGDKDRLAVSQKAFSERWQSFSAGRLPDDDDPDQPPSAEGQEAETFESDIAGLFRQQTQAKRNFALPPRAKAGDGFTDYDVEAGQSSGMADERYMAESALDADAAALQAALEGSLRERHAEEARTGSGGLALAAAWAVFLSVLSGVMLAFVNFRDDIVVALPGMGALYRNVGLGVQEQQVDFGPVNYRWTVADGKPMIEVTGQIINLTDRDIPVPRVLINVRDKESSDTIKATATVRSDPLSAGETADFTLEFISPSKTISQIELAFAERTE